MKKSNMYGTEINDNVEVKAIFSKIVFLPSKIFIALTILIMVMAIFDKSIIESAEMSTLEFFIAMPISAVIASFLLSIPGKILHKFNKLYIRGRSIYGRTGIIRVREMSSPISKVENIESSKTFMGSLFNYGTISITTTSGEYNFKYVEYPEEFREIVMTQIERYQESQMDMNAYKIANAIKNTK